MWCGDHSPVRKVAHEVIVVSCETIVNNNHGMKLEDTPAETLGTWLKRQLSQREWNGADLAKRLNSSNGTVSNWMNGVRTPNPETVMRIASVLGADVDYLLTLAGHRPPDPYFDPDSAEAQLLPYIRAIEWTPRDLAIIKAQLETMIKAQKGELDR
jgi:transcriptional regulator with XRE-family HTH domain